MTDEQIKLHPQSSAYIDYNGNVRWGFAKFHLCNLFKTKSNGVLLFEHYCFKAKIKFK